MSDYKVLFIQYDNGSAVPFPPLNYHYLTAALSAAGHDSGIFADDLEHSGDQLKDTLRPILNTYKFEVIGLGFCAGYYQYREALRISKVLAELRSEFPFKYVIGGHGPAADPKYFRKKLRADYVVVGDGEQALIDIVEGKELPGTVKGSPQKCPANLTDVLGSFAIEIYRHIKWPKSKDTDYCYPILSSRGCKWKCSFCYRMRDGFALRPVEEIIKEIEFLHKNFGVNHIQFADELLMADPARTRIICKAIKGLKYKIKWDCNGRLNYATPGLLKLMKESGCTYINYGIESLDQKLLNRMKKGLTVKQIEEGVINTLVAGISPGLNFIWGFPGDTLDNLRKMVKFLLSYDDGAELRTIRPVTPYPGTKLFKEAVQKGLLKDTADFYENKHVNSDLLTVNFTDVTTRDAHMALMKANNTLVANHYAKKSKAITQRATQFYKGFTKPNEFRGFRPV